VLLDGSHDWLTPPAEPVGLFQLDLPGRRPAPTVELAVDPVVTTLVKADLRCAAVAAASVLAKVERDAIMVGRAQDFPDYGWRENKGYSAPEHAVALRRLGPCPQHRQTWSLPVAERLAVAGPDDDEAAQVPGPARGVREQAPAQLQLADPAAAGAGEDLGRRADAVVALRHDGAVAR
jgi:ribonuclease HII